MPSITRVVIAQPLSTIRDADRIYVLDAGRMERGTHEQLTRRDEVFSALAGRQPVKGSAPTSAKRARTS